jgi:hypothetical protein
VKQRRLVLKKSDYLGLAVVAGLGIFLSPLFGGLGAGLIFGVIYCRKLERNRVARSGLWAIPIFAIVLTAVLLSPKIWPFLQTDWETPTPWDNLILALSLLGFLSFQGLLTSISFTLSQLVIFRRRKAQLNRAKNSSDH